jgi:hypothetical protein
MEAALAREKAAQIQCLSGPDPLAGMMAWMQGEPPRFSER